MSKFQVMSRKQCEAFCTLSHNNPFVIISISTPNDLPYANFHNSFLKDVIYLHFGDWDDKRSDCITEVQAGLIYNFAHCYFYNPDIGTIIVHCDGGVSRSAGVAAALMNIFEGDDWDIFENPRYCPNMLCYRRVLESHYEKLTPTEEEEILKKQQHNTQAWLEIYHEDLL